MIFLQYLFTPLYFYGTLGLIFLLSLIAIGAVRRKSPRCAPAAVAHTETEPADTPKELPPQSVPVKPYVDAVRSPKEKKEQRAQLKTILRKLHRRSQEKPLGNILLEQNLITINQLDDALKLQNSQKKDMLLGEILIAQGHVTEEQIMTAVMVQYHLHYIPLENYTLKKEILDIIPAHIAWKYLVIPVEKVMRSLTVAMFNPLNKVALMEIETASKCSVVPCLAKPSELKKLVREYYTTG